MYKVIFQLIEGEVPWVYYLRWRKLAPCGVAKRLINCNNAMEEPAKKKSKGLGVPTYFTLRLKDSFIRFIMLFAWP